MGVHMNERHSPEAGYHLVVLHTGEASTSAIYFLPSLALGQQRRRRGKQNSLLFLTRSLFKMTDPSLGTQQTPFIFYRVSEY